MEASWPNEVFGILPRRGMLEDRGVLPKESGNQLRECGAVHEDNFLSKGLLEDVEGVTAEMERLNEEAKQEESKSGKREVWSERGEHLRSKEGVWIGCPAKFLTSASFLRWRVWRFPLDFRCVCLLGLLLCLV